MNQQHPTIVLNEYGNVDTQHYLNQARQMRSQVMAGNVKATRHFAKTTVSDIINFFGFNKLKAS